MANASFSAGLSGLNANALYLTVIGNNLANINTVGFKSSTVSFMDLVSQNVGGSSVNPMQVGLGVTVGSVSPVFSQGSVESTREATNVAIQGNGFFVVRGSEGTSYTRAGNFSLDASGTLVTPDGYKVQGYTQIDPSTGRIVTGGLPTDITVPAGVMRPPVATTSFRALTNLDASAAVGTAFSTSVQMYDALGPAHVVTFTYTKTGPGAWSYQASVPGSEVVGGTPGTPYRIPAGSGGAGTVTFSTDGRLLTVNGGAPADVTITTPAWLNGASPNAINWDIMDANLVPSLTGYSSGSATTSITQNGSAPGMVQNVSVSADGTISATFGAGQTVPIAQLALAIFNNPKGLVKAGSNRYGESQAAGIANVGAAGLGGRGTLVGGALEQSNVDIAEEFTKMILAQRGYQANAKTITVSDELLVDALNIKR